MSILLGCKPSLLSIQRFLSKALSVQPEERPFWKTVLHELVSHLTLADIISSFDETIDYRLNYDFSPADLASWKGKILILQSDDDPATTVSMRTALCRLYPQAQTYTFHQAGHTPFLSQPDKFYSYVRTFLKEGGSDVSRKPGNN